MVCKDAVLLEPILKNCTIKCPTFEENTRQPYDGNLCPFRALQFEGHPRLEEKKFKILNLFLSGMDRLSPSQFPGVHTNDIPFVEGIFSVYISLFDIDIVNSNVISQLTWRSGQKHEKTVILLSYKSIICYVSNPNAVFQSFRCPDCDTFSNRKSNFE